MHNTFMCCVCVVCSCRHTRVDVMTSLIKTLAEGYTQPQACYTLNATINEGGAKMSLSRASMIVQTYNVVKYTHTHTVHSRCSTPYML